ncbi:MAG: ABC transporter substrate-binding protein [Phycisphaerales bacterium]|nr:ABC transporter substrate-binding protein [Phycisphaerales bacterium]
MPAIELTLGHSPDSDDMVMWWPLTGVRGPDGRPVPGLPSGPILDTGPFRFRAFAHDVQRLNRRAIDRGDLDVSAISAHAYPYVCAQYAITRSGASMGEGYGPKVVVRQRGGPSSLSDLWARLRADPELTVAIPGRQTTAYLVLRLLAGRDVPVREMLFSDIPSAVSRGEAEAGVLIHEAQLTFEALGLAPIADLGRAWTDRTGLPLPLGLNVIRRDLDSRFGAGTLHAVARMLGDSVRAAVAHPEISRALLLAHSGDRPEWRDDDLVKQYLRMYVSPLTVDLGDRGVLALTRLFGEAAEAGLCPATGGIEIVG